MQAEKLACLGFLYKEKVFKNKIAYEFFGTEELMKELNSNFDKSSFFMTKNMCF